MYPTLYDILKDLLGIDWSLLKVVQSYGLMVAMAFIVSSWFLMQELKRKERQGLVTAIEKKIEKGKPATATELSTSGILGFMLGFKLVGAFFQYDFFVNSPQDYLLSGEGNVLGGIVVGALSAFLRYRDKRQEIKEKTTETTETIHPYNLTGNIVLYAALFGILGAKVFHNLENWDELMTDPIGSIFSFSGLTYYGGLITATFAVLYYAGKNGVRWIHMLDTAAPALLLAYGLGRLGCQIAGDGCWGIINLQPQPDWLSWLPEWTWAYQYPNNVINEGILHSHCVGRHCTILENPVYPTPLYESVFNLVAFACLWGLRKRISTPGMMFSVYLIINGAERFWIEKIRVNTEYVIFGHGITQAEIISTGLVLLGFAGIWFAKKYGKRYVNQSG